MGTTVHLWALALLALSPLVISYPAVPSWVWHPLQLHMGQCHHHDNTDALHSHSCPRRTAELPVRLHDNSVDLLIQQKSGCSAARRVSHYLAVIPAVLHHPNTEKFCIFIDSPEPVHLTVTLHMSIKNHTLIEQDLEKARTFECIDFQVPAFVPKEKSHDLLDEEVARVHVLIQKGGSVSFEGQKKVLVRHAYVKNIIATDKPFYKPGERVKFRILKLNEDFKAIDKPINLIKLKDPDDNIIGQWTDVKTVRGIADLSFPLAAKATEGTYSITVGTLSEADELSERAFTVQEYELPKFEVLLELPSLVTTVDEVVELKMCSRYTYGKPVQGTVKLRLLREMYNTEETNGTLSDIEKEYSGQTDKTGCAHFAINGTDINLLEEGYANYVSVSAEMEEDGTGEKRSDSGEILIALKEVRLNFNSLNAFYKKGFPYAGKIHVSIFRVPVQNRTIYLTVDVNDVETHIPYVTDEHGEVSFSLDTTDWDDMVSLRARYSIENITQSEDILKLSESDDFTWLKPFYSESNSFLEIRHVDEDLPCGKSHEILVDYTLDRKELDPEADHVDFYYLVESRGRIAYNGKKQLPVGKDETLKGTFSLNLPINSDLAPSARLLIYAVFPDGEVSADVDVFTIEKCFKHKVSLNFLEQEELPGSKVNLRVKAAPGALCSLHALDKSVILKENQTLTPENIYEVSYYLMPYSSSGRGFAYRLEDFEPYPCLLPLDSSQKQKRSLQVAPWYQSVADVYSLFKQLQLKVITNTDIKQPVSCDISEGRKPLLKSITGEALTDDSESDSNVVAQPLNAGGVKRDEKATPRTYFPETWIWDLIQVNEEGKATHSVTVPDTITEWHASAFCVADVGFGLSHQATIRVFQPFFVDLRLPSSVVRGESFKLQVTVFNYLKECIQVQVTLAESQELEAKPCPTCEFLSCLCEAEAKTLYWTMTANHLGHVNISVTAEAQEAHELCGNKISVTPARGRSDTVVKALLVKPEGVPKEEAQNAFICSSGGPVQEDISLKLPENVVSDSGHATIFVIGDVLGGALENIGQQLKLPLGCGEQNLMMFVPDIFIRQYLENTNQATPDFIKKATEFMEIGYQRQLYYKHEDGSYSAFGKRDPEGNTWLTAAVARGFGQAKAYIYVDDKHIQDAVHWLGGHQLPSGCFKSVGRLFNNALKGKIDDDYSLTAYITAVLLELQWKSNKTILEDALLCLKTNLSAVDEAYPKALLAYVFTLAGDTETREKLLKDLEKQIDDPEPSFMSVETTAYFILAYLSGPEVSKDEIVSASKIVKVLSKHQNPYGGFSSTQDTVVALQGLSKYAALTYREIENLKVLVKSDSGFQHGFRLDTKNRLVLQQASLPEIPGQYKVEVSGNGCAHIQTVLQYSAPPAKSEAFALSAETSPKECNQASRKHFEIHLQVSYIGERNASNMALIEVTMPSGYIPAEDTVKKLLAQPLVKSVDIDPQKVVIYLDQLDKAVQDYSLFVKQETEVIDLKPTIVKVFDYYHPEDYVFIEYLAPCGSEQSKTATDNLSKGL